MLITQVLGSAKKQVVGCGKQGYGAYKGKKTGKPVCDQVGDEGSVHVYLRCFRLACQMLTAGASLKAEPEKRECISLFYDW